IGIADTLRDVAQNALQERAVDPPDEGSSSTEREAIGEEQPKNADEARDGKTRHHRIADVLLAYHAAVEQSEARKGHHKHDSHRGEHPGGIARIWRALFKHGRLGGRVARGRRRGRCCSGFRRRGSGSLSVGSVKRRYAQEEAEQNPEGESQEPRTGGFLQRHGFYSCPYCLRCGFLERRGIGLAGADAHGVFQIEDEDFPITDLSGLRGASDGPYDFVDLLGVYCHFNLDLRQEAHRILGTTVDFRVPFLTPVSFDLSNGQSLHADGGQSVTDLVELERFDNSHDDFHGFDPRLSPFVTSRSAGGFTEAFAHEACFARKGRRDRIKPRARWMAPSYIIDSARLIT